MNMGPNRGEWEEDPSSHSPPSQHPARLGEAGRFDRPCAKRISEQIDQFRLGVITGIRPSFAGELIRFRDGDSPEITGPGMSVSTKTAGISPSSWQ